MLKKYFIVNSVDEAIVLGEKYGDCARVIAGGTDLVLEIEREARTGIEVLIDLTRIPGADQITIDNKNVIHLGPVVTHNACVNSGIIRSKAFCLWQACLSVGSPQIRNRGTVVGNVVTASPANDTITALMSLEAQVEIRSKSGIKTIALSDFYKGFRQTTLKPGEIVTGIHFNALSNGEKSNFIKQGLRKAQAISLMNISAVIKIEQNEIADARIALGSVAPVVIRAKLTEQYLRHKPATKDVFNEAGRIAESEVRPIDDIRGSAAYRKSMVSVQVKNALINAMNENLNGSSSTVLLWGVNQQANTPLVGESIELSPGQSIEVEINGKQHKIQDAFHKNLMDMIRENVGLTGTKEGCGEGECGACTVFMDGIAVLACLIPAPRAHKTRITTIEGVAKNGELHKVQQAFIDVGAVQCGYCTPGFVMSAIKLLEEKTTPTNEEIKMGISGNLCRCTGYYKIISAIEKAALRKP